MGSHIADALIPLLKRDQQLVKAKSQLTQKEAKEEEERIYEEEDGSSKSIRSGYVVVRKKDLD